MKTETEELTMCELKNVCGGQVQEGAYNVFGRFFGRLMNAIDYASENLDYSHSMTRRGI